MSAPSEEELQALDRAIANEDVIDTHIVVPLIAAVRELRAAFDTTRHRLLDRLGMEHGKGWFHVESAIVELRADAEALRAERHEHATLATEHEKCFRAALAEVERLRGMVREACTGCADADRQVPGREHYEDCPVALLQADRDRLRAALEAIVKAWDAWETPHAGPVREAIESAREALKQRSGSDAGKEAK